MAQLVECLLSTQVMIPESWDRALRQAPRSAWSLLLPLPLPLPVFLLVLSRTHALTLTLANKYIKA